MGVNKVEFGSTTLVDLTADTVTFEDVRSGVTFHDGAGDGYVGALEIVKFYTSYLDPNNATGQDGDLYLLLSAGAM